MANTISSTLSIAPTEPFLDFFSELIGYEQSKLSVQIIRLHSSSSDCAQPGNVFLGHTDPAESPESKACSIRVGTRRLHKLAPFFNLAAVIGSELFGSAPDRIRTSRGKPFFDVRPPQNFHGFLLQP